MAKLTERFFDSKDQMTEALSTLLKEQLSSGIEQDGKAVLMVSGEIGRASCRERVYAPV